MNFKKQYSSPVAELVYFAPDDIITTSNNGTDPGHDDDFGLFEVDSGLNPDRYTS